VSLKQAVYVFPLIPFPATQRNNKKFKKIAVPTRASFPPTLHPPPTAESGEPVSHTERPTNHPSISMATEGDQRQATEEVVSVEMPAPEGWTKKVGGRIRPVATARSALRCAASLRTGRAGFELRVRGIRGCGSGIRAGGGCAGRVIVANFREVSRVWG
jgi:hypothetical protein